MYRSDEGAPPRTPRAVGRLSSAAFVSLHVREMVFTGQLRPGDRVRQDDIAEQLGVSRIPVREAMVALDREGWVTLEHHRGAFISGLDREGVSDHYEVLGRLYGMLGRRACERGADEQLKRFPVLFDAVQGAADADALQVANDAYLAHLHDVAGSHRLRSVSRVITGVVPGNFFARVPGANDTQVRGLALATTALEARDTAGVARALLDMLREQGARVLELLEAQGIVVERAATR